MYRVALLVLLTLTLVSAQASAQYLYLDSNGDGVNSSADVVAPTGPTTFDIWIHTDQNRDGSPATCVTEDGELTINSYEFVLHTIGGLVTWSGFVNHQANFTTSFGSASSSTDYYTGLGGGVIQPPGLYRLASLTATRVAGTPSIQIVTTTPLGPAFITSFGSRCSGNDFDNTLKLGSDWTGADGLPFGGTSIVHPPVWTPVANMSLQEGETADQTITATDPDGNALTFSKVAGPSFMTVTTVNPGSGTGTGNIHVVASPRDAGHYPATVRVTDGTHPVDAFFAIDVAAVGFPVNLLPIEDVTVVQHSFASFLIEAVSPESDGSTFSLVEGPEFVEVQQFGARRGRVVLRPKLRTDVGTFTAIVAAHDGFYTDTESFEITVSANYQNPTVTVSAPSVEIHTDERVTVSVSDPDGDPITNLFYTRGDDLPAGHVTSFQATLTGGSGASGTLLWTPSTTGVFRLRFTAMDAFGGFRLEAPQVQVHSRASVIAAPVEVHGAPFQQITFEVTASDPDGDPIQDLNADLGLPGFFGATFTEDPSHTRGTFSWTPDETFSGSFIGKTHPSTFGVRFFASDGDLIGETSTNIVVSYVDQDRLDPNNLDLAVGSSGQTGYNIYTEGAGLVYPKGSQTSVLFGMGPWIAGKLGNTLHISRGGSNTEFFPGTMSGTTPTPFHPRFRGYRIERGVTTGEDYLTWPAADGAPVDQQGLPRMDGDEMVWSVYNEDGQRNRQGTGWEYDAGTVPAGLEVRQSTFAFDAPGPLQTIDFIRFEITNPGAARFDSAYVALWSDPDVGDPFGDLAGCDPALGLGYVYNGPGSDLQYGATPPAFGLALLESPDASGSPGSASAFSVYSPSISQSRGLTPTESFLMMKGLNRDGSSVHRNDDPSQPITPFRYDGDPVAGTGWLDPLGGDKRIVLSSGVFSIGPGETKECVAAILVGHGNDHLASVSALRDLVPIARYVAASGYVLLPYVKAPAAVTVNEGDLLQIEIDALDLDGAPLTALTVELEGLPLGHDASFTPEPSLTGGVLTWTPTFSDAGTYEVRFTAANDQSATFSMQVHVLQANRPPVAVAGGPYTGVAGLPLALAATGSSDPDGDALTYAWTYGDGESGVGLTVQHTYSLGGSFDVTVRVSDGSASDLDSTKADIASSIQARAYVSQGEARIRLSSNRPLHCFRLEPVNGSFALENVDLQSIRLVSAGTGSVEEIPASTDKTLPAVDRDENGIQELTVCFSKAGLRRLLDRLPPGETTVEAAIEGAIASGVRFRAPVSFSVQSSGALASSIAPNPMNPDAVLTFRVVKSGRHRVTLLDVHGKLVQVVHDRVLDPGYHELRLESRTRSGERLASGVYFYVIESSEGAERGRVVVLK